MFKKIVLIFFVVLLSACNSDDDNYYYQLMPIEEADLPEFFEYGKVYLVTVRYQIPNDCLLYPELIYEYDLDAREVGVVGTFVDSKDCSELEDVTRNFTFRVQALQREDYVFKFWQGEDENGDSIYLEVVVPVENFNNQITHGFKETHTWM